jgi:hypothetical protein
MYAMATELIETVTHFTGTANDPPAFLPLAPGVLYEFGPADGPDDPATLLGPLELVPGRSYTLVASDAFGLRRYQTGDVFACTRRIAPGGLPDLHFQRRRDLSYSFTGEKLTGEQATAVLDGLRGAGLDSGAFATLIPSQPADEAIPHYRLLIAAPTAAAAPELSALADRCEALLRALNPEYRAKTASGRLGPVRAMALPVEALASLVGGARQQRTWEAQLKFLPLYQRTLEDLHDAAERR